jgi:hypothetical protein
MPNYNYYNPNDWSNKGVLLAKVYNLKGTHNVQGNWRKCHVTIMTLNTPGDIYSNPHLTVEVGNTNYHAYIAVKDGVFDCTEIRGQGMNVMGGSRTRAGAHVFIKKDSTVWNEMHAMASEVYDDSCNALNGLPVFLNLIAAPVAAKPDVRRDVPASAHKRYTWGKG